MASFWFGEKLVVSVASPELFKETNYMFDRPVELFLLVEPIITMDSIQYANGADGRNRRKIYDQSFSHQAIEQYYDIFQERAEELANKWALTPKDEHIPLGQSMVGVAIKGIAESAFGDLFNDDNEVVQLKRNYDVAFNEIERRAGGDIPAPDSPEQKRLDTAKNQMHDLIRRAMELRENKTIEPGHELLIDNIMKLGSENQKLADAISYALAGFHTSGYWMTWALYYMALHPEIQEKVYDELIDVLEEERVTNENMTALKYMRQVLDETQRIAPLGPYAARYQDVEIEIGGHKIPPGTPIVQALAVVLSDSKLWPEPKKFDPERFNEENSKSRPFYAFQPFGFAGKRKCPGYQYAYAEVTVVLAVILRKFKVKLVEGQVIKRRTGIITVPLEEIWITVEKRN